MKFEHFLGTDICGTADEIGKIMSKQNQDGYNEFWISGDEEFPFMAVLTRNQNAYVHFFDEDGSPGLRGMAEKGDNTLDANDVTVFRSNNGSEQITVENECVIPLEKAIAVVKEFFEAKGLPEIIQWDPLWEEAD